MADQEASIDLGIVGLGPAEHIGRGGFADVYRAEQLSLRRTVAVKVLRAQAVDAEVEARFERECYAIGAVADHPHIVGVHEGGFTRNGRAYLVMEYLPGGSLLDRVAEHGPIEVSEIVDTGVKIARALSVAHQAGVLHRDVKPANIMISAYGEPALGDFGIARIEGGHQTMTGLVTASFAHAAPEVLEGLPPTAKADIYSLGSTIFELLTGHAPYYRSADESIWPLMKRILSEPMPTPESVGMSPQLGQVFLRATARQASARYDSADEMADDLEALVGDPLALARYPSTDDLMGGHRRGTSDLTGQMDVPTRSSATGRGSQVGIGLPGGPPPATTPDLMAPLDRTDVLPTAMAPQPDGHHNGAVDGSRGSKRGGKTVVLGLLAVAVPLLAAVGFLVTRSNSPSTDSDVALSVVDVASGPLAAGVGYELAVTGAPVGSQLRLVVDGNVVGEALPSPPVFEPPPGRHTVAVEVVDGDDVALSAPLQFYAVADEAPAGFRAVIASVSSQPRNWSAVLAVYDRLQTGGHDELELLVSDDVANLSAGRWDLYVAGFGTGDEAEAYCERFELVVPDHCHVSFLPTAG